nr:MAG TPA: hypothetical protein [Caudoviricetes sp.]
MIYLKSEKRQKPLSNKILSGFSFRGNNIILLAGVGAKI